MVAAEAVVTADDTLVSNAPRRDVGARAGVFVFVNICLFVEFITVSVYLSFCFCSTVFSRSFFLVLFLWIVISIKSSHEEHMCLYLKFCFCLLKYLLLLSIFELNYIVKLMDQISIFSHSVMCACIFFNEFTKALYLPVTRSILCNNIQNFCDGFYV